MTAPEQPDPRTTAIHAHLSTPRLAPYLAASNNNLKGALRLYQWNVDLSGAAYEALHVFEVVLRNATDAQLAAWNVTQVEPHTNRQHDADWLIDPARLLQRLAGDDIEKATKRAKTALRTNKRGGRAPGHPDLLAQLSFGTWRFLLPDNDPGRQLLWRDALCQAFPRLSSTPRQLVSKVDGIYRLRNRVAHLEPLLRSVVVREQVAAMREVLAAIDPHVETWFTSRQRVSAVLKARPR